MSKTYTIHARTNTCTTEWSETAELVDVQDFTQPVGPSTYIPNDPLGCFSLFFNDNVIDTIVTDTNRYAQQVLEGQNKQWSTNAAEIRAYFGFAILMGIITYQKLEITGAQILTFTMLQSPIE